MQTRVPHVWGVQNLICVSYIKTKDFLCWLKKYAIHWDWKICNWLRLKEIESIQKLAFKIILGPAYVTYEAACKYFHTFTLEQRRHNICLKFVNKNIESDNSLFEPSYPHNRNLRPRKAKVKELRCNTVRFQKSSIPYLSTLANST